MDTHNPRYPLPQPPTKEWYKTKIAALQAEIGTITTKLEAIDSDIDNNVFASHNEAELRLTCRFEEVARQDCEGSHNCGAEEYAQRYRLTDNDTTFEAIVSFEYNRHDKTYYYIDGSSYSYEAVA